MKNKEKKGFTLIELLVVVAIIGILIFAILAYIQNSRGKSNRAAFLKEARSASVGFTNQCLSGAITYPSSDQMTWTAGTADCGPGGAGNFCARVVNLKKFVDTPIGDCTIYVSQNGLHTNATCTTSFNNASSCL